MTTAVAVPGCRRDEVDILHSINEAAIESGVEFVPFKSKSTHFSKEDDRAFFSRLISTNERRLTGLHFHHESASRNQHYVEAVLTAILVAELHETLPSPWFVLVDGDENKVRTLAKACAGLEVDSPSLTNCYKAEWYYPHSLLADLVAGYLSWQLDTGRYDYTDPLLRVPAADRTKSELWGTAFSYLQRKQRQPAYEPLDFGIAMADNESDRMRIWHDGRLARGEARSAPLTSPRHVVAAVEEFGYEPLADRLRRL